MCGIAGFVSLKGNMDASPDRLASMVRTLFHRGPDESGTAIHDGVAMGMRRLSIIDLSGGQQPIYNEDQSVWTVFNGEIYNFKTLRQELIKKGHVFRTQSDTEVIVHAYEEYETEFPKYLNGMFAIALHDRKRKRLILVRDHIGIKPLYYWMDGNYLVFGSEIKAILASGLITRELNISGLAAFLAWEYVPGKATLFRSVNKLEPASYLDIHLEDRQSFMRAYWDIPAPFQSHACRNEYEWADAVDQQIQKSTRMQMISDVPLGAFLSGGVDSSLIVSAMGQARTFSIGFDDPTYNELPWARKVADYLGVNHTDEIIRPDAVQLFDRLMHFMDDPIGDFSIFPTYLVSALARRFVTVALSGDGGDELFGGYETYLAEMRAKWYLHIPRLLRQNGIERMIGQLTPTARKKGLVNKAIRFVEGIHLPAEMCHARWRYFISDALKNELFTPEALALMSGDHPASHITDMFRMAGERGHIDRCLYVDVKTYLCDNILTKVDRMSMAVSLETRVPYLDPDLVTLAFQIPEKFKVSERKTKILLKRVAGRHIPHACIYRPKEGFSIPMKNWLNREFRPLMDSLLELSDIRRDGLFRVDTIERLKTEHHNGKANHSHILWALIVFHDWKKRWLDHR